mmetsp:Transcript_29407/g.36336  ORF Transcript_29407/g.36336 Transcript_29407/m.36336 type:complete len:104 (-) Transcript_29407:291-602(-)
MAKSYSFDISGRWIYPPLTESLAIDIKVLPPINGCCGVGAVGSWEGLRVGKLDGSGVGNGDGSGVGNFAGLGVGYSVGSGVGNSVGNADGSGVGKPVCGKPVG